MRIFPLITLLLVPLLVQAQRKLNPDQNFWQLIFSKQDITWDWRGKYYYVNDQGDGPGIRLESTLTSNLLPQLQEVPNTPNLIGVMPFVPSTIRRGGSAPQVFESIRTLDEHQLDGFFFYRSNAIAYGLYTKSWTLTDRQAGTVNTFSNNVLGLKAIYKIKQNISLDPYFGYQRSQNKSITEWGWDLGVKGKIRDYPVGNYRTFLDLASDYDFYRDRQNSLNALDIGIKTSFSPKARDSLSVTYSKENQQYFTPDAAYLVNVKIENRQLVNLLYYSLSNRSRVELNTFLRSRNIFDDAPGKPNIRDVMRVENRINFYHFSSRFIYSLGFHTFQENSDNAGRDISTDSELMQTSLKFDLSYLLSNRDQFDLELSYVKFQYDTPDSMNNHDDRDELRLIGLFRYSRQFSPLLRFHVEAYLNFYHKIYIFKEQSANNNWNRIYRLGAVVKYNNHNWRNSLRTQVLANYTVYDFEQIFNETRSFIFRKYVLSDSLLIPFFADLSLGIHGRLEMEDRGSFYKSEFSQRLLESNISAFYDIYLEKKKIFYFDTVLGVAIYQYNGWRHVPKKRKDRDITKVSPYLRIFYPLSQNLRFVGYVSINYLRDLGRLISNYTTGNLNLYYHF
jgi:hypothetical protein